MIVTGRPPHQTPPSRRFAAHYGNRVLVPHNLHEDLFALPGDRCITRDALCRDALRTGQPLRFVPYLAGGN